jgi:hypothetical protein
MSFLSKQNRFSASKTHHKNQIVMKHIFSSMGRVVLLWLCLPGFAAVAQVAQTADTYVRPYTETFQYGANMGYYGTGWDDEKLAGLLHQAGGHSLRPTLPEWLVEYYGYNARVSTFNHYVNDLEMKEMSCFVGDPVPDHRDFTVYPGCTGSSKMFSHMYEPIWNTDGTVNQNNYYAYYIYRLLQLYGDNVRFWEIMNEPDFANGGSGAAWLTRAPTPAEQINTQAPFYFYIRMLRISYEVIKKYHPEAYVSVGAGYPEYVDALMRYTDEPTVGATTSQYPRKGGAYFDVISYHAYPNYSLHYWDNSIGGFRYTRTSDYSANKVIEFKNQMTAVLTRYQYDGTLHPAKYITLNESNVSRRTSDDRISSDEAQRNFTIKTLVLNQKNDIKQFYYYAIGEKVNAPAAGQSVSGGDEIGLMGLYENLYRDGPGSAKLVQAGNAFTTTSKMLYGYKYDAARTAALNLPAAIDGGAFSKNGEYVYVLWAKALIDNIESAAATYSFPAALNIGSVQRYAWNYSVTGTKTTIAAAGIALTETPVFFVPVATAPVVTCSATGTLLREQWSNVSGGAIADIPLAANVSSSTSLTQLEGADTYGYNYGARLRGYVCPPQSGSYTFYVAGDDQAELWLSPDADPARAVRVASCTNWTASNRDFYRYASQQSAAVALVAGTRYYLEVRHKQGWGPGYVAVAWRLPNSTTEEPIPGTRLSPFVPVASRGISGTSATPAVSQPGSTATELTVAPNPFSQQASVQFNLTTAGPVSLAVYDVQGKLVRQLFTGTSDAGVSQRFTVDAQGLSSGLYILKLVTAQNVLTQKLMLSK